MGFSGVSWAADFVHLHVASAYSLRYGVASPAALVGRAAQQGMRALALTDRDGLYGAVKHAVACAEAGVATILGADLALAGASGVRPAGAALAGAALAGSGRVVPAAPGGMAPAGDPSARILNSAAPARLRSEDAARVTLLASGRRGWASLCRLVSAAHQAGARGAPVITPGLVAEHAEGLIILLGPGSDVGRAIAARRPDHAAAALARWREHGEVVIEITDHRTRGSTHRAARMLRLAREAGVTAVLTNAVRYLDPPDAAVAQVLDAARQLAPLSERHLARRNARAYLASGDDMAAIAARVCGTPGGDISGGGIPGGAVSAGGAPGAGGSGDSAMTQLLHATAVLAERCTLDPQRDLGLGFFFDPATTGGAP